MKSTLAVLALCAAASFAYAQDEGRTYALDRDPTYAPDEAQTYAPGADETYAPDEDDTYTPVQDQTYAQHEDDTYTPVQDQTYAQDEGQTLAPIVVEGSDVDRMVVECQPPNDAAACANFHELIRQNFTPREIGMLFGGTSAHFEYPVNYDRVRERYVAFLQNVRDKGMPVPVSYQY